MTALTRYADDGRAEIDNNAAEREQRSVAVGRKNYLFAGSDAGGDRAAVIYSLIENAKLNAINPHTWLSDVIGRIADHPARQIDQLLTLELVAPLSAAITGRLQALHAYLEEKRGAFSRNHNLYKAINYMLKRWPAFTLFLDDGRVCLSNNAAEQALRGIALGRRSWLFCGSDRGGRRHV